MRACTLLLVLASGVVAWIALAPFHSERVVRQDGLPVIVLAPDRLRYTSDVWDYLQQGRQIAEGGGLTSLTTYVPLLPESVTPGARDRGVFPVLWRQPGYPLLVAAALRLGGGNPRAIVLLQGLSVVLLALASYFLATAVLAPPWAAAAALWAVSSPLALGLYDPLVATTWHAAAVTLALALALRATNMRGAVGAAAALAAAAYLRLEALLLVPAVLAILWPDHDRPGRRRAAAFVVALILLAAPWFVRTARITGDPFYNAASLIRHDTPAFPGWSASQTMASRDTGTITFVRDHAADVFVKTGGNMARFARDLVALPHLALAPFLWFGVWACRTAPTTRRVALAAIIAASVLCIALSPLQYAARYLACLVPVFCTIAAVGLSRVSPYRGAIAVAATALALAGLGWSLGRVVTDGTARTAVAEVAAAPLGESGGELILSDAPEIVAWIWRRPGVWSPLPGDVAFVQRSWGRVLGVVTCAGAEGELAGEYRAVGGTVTGTCPAIIRFADAGEQR